MTNLTAIVGSVMAFTYHQFGSVRIETGYPIVDFTHSLTVCQMKDIAPFVSLLVTTVRPLGMW